MAVYLVERNFDEELDFDDEKFEQINDITNELGVEWLTSFLSADGKKTYCLYEATDPDQLRNHSKVVGIPANRIIEVSRFWPLPDKS